MRKLILALALTTAACGVPDTPIVWETYEVVCSDVAEAPDDGSGTWVVLTTLGANDQLYAANQRYTITDDEGTFTMVQPAQLPVREGGEVTASVCPRGGPIPVFEFLLGIARATP